MSTHKFNRVLLILETNSDHQSHLSLDEMKSVVTLMQHMAQYAHDPNEFCCSFVTTSAPLFQSKFFENQLFSWHFWSEKFLIHMFECLFGSRWENSDQKCPYEAINTGKMVKKFLEIEDEIIGKYSKMNCKDTLVLYWSKSGCLNLSDLASDLNGLSNVPRSNFFIISKSVQQMFKLAGGIVLLPDKIWSIENPASLLFVGISFLESITNSSFLCPSQPDLVQISIKNCTDSLKFNVDILLKYQDFKLERLELSEFTHASMAPQTSLKQVVAIVNLTRDLHSALNLDKARTFVAFDEISDLMAVNLTDSLLLVGTRASSPLASDKLDNRESVISLEFDEKKVDRIISEIHQVDLSLNTSKIDTNSSSDDIDKQASSQQHSTVIERNPYYFALYSENSIDEWTINLLDTKKMAKDQGVEEFVRFFRQMWTCLENSFTLKQKWQDTHNPKLTETEKRYFDDFVGFYRKFPKAKCIIVRETQMQIILCLELLRSLYVIKKNKISLEIDTEEPDDYEKLEKKLIENVDDLVDSLVIQFSCPEFDEDETCCDNSTGVSSNLNVKFDDEQKFFDSLLESSRHYASKILPVINSIRSKVSTEFFSPVKRPDRALSKKRQYTENYDEENTLDFNKPSAIDKMATMIKISKKQRDNTPKKTQKIQLKSGHVLPFESPSREIQKGSSRLSRKTPTRFYNPRIQIPRSKNSPVVKKNLEKDLAIYSTSINETPKKYQNTTSTSNQASEVPETPQQAPSSPSHHKGSKSPNFMTRKKFLVANTPVKKGSEVIAPETPL